MAHGRRCARGGPLGGDLGHRGRGGHLGRRDGEVAAAVASAYFHRLGRHAQVGMGKRVLCDHSASLAPLLDHALVVCVS